MSRRFDRGRWRLPAMAAIAYGLALLQRPGETVVDTRLELSVDPGLFVERAFHVWSATTDLGHVQGGQFNGYLFPMGPWFAGGDALGVPMWLLQRIWLGTLLLLAAWGAARLMDALLGRRSNVASCGAGLVFALNPYVVQFTSRGTVTLLAYAALPWLMLAVHRGLREPRRWLMPAAIGLVLAAAGGGVNAAVLAFALLGPLALAVFELATRAVRWRDVAAFGWRTALTGTLACAWWVVPLLVQAGYGENFLLFTEQPRTIWGTTSISELIRMLGFWGLYTGVGYGGSEPFMDVAGTYLFNPLVVIATFLVPLVAVAGYPAVRGWRYAPFFALLAALAIVVMFAGFPEGTRLRELLVDVYDGVPPIQFLRTTYKAAPLLVLALACLAGAAAAELHRRLSGRRVAGIALLAGLAGIVLLAALPMVAGRAIDSGQAYGEVPGWWRAATAGSPDHRARTWVLPGELFGFYRWGDTMDPVAPALRRGPVAIREIVPYADPRSSQLQIAIDDLVQQGRLVPGQLEPLLALTGSRDILVARDSRHLRSGALDPVAVEWALEGQPELSRVADYGKRRLHLPARGRSGEPATLPDISRMRVPGFAGAHGVGVLPAGPATVLEGDAEGVADLAAHGLLEPRLPLFYAGDLDRGRLARLTAAGATLVLGDSARRRVFIAARLRANRGPTLGPDDPIPADAPVFEPFRERGQAGRTVAMYSGLRRLFSPLAPGFSQFPQYRPYAALDGRADTEWRADEHVPPEDWYMQLELRRPRPVGAIELVPQRDPLGQTLSVHVSQNGGAEREVRLRPGANRIELDADALSTLRLRVGEIGGPEDTRGAGGIAELRIPGLRVRERLRLPTALATAARGLDLSRSPIVVTLQRTTADFPYRAGAAPARAEADSALAMVDAEQGLEREIELPEARGFELTGWGSVPPSAPDDAIDRLAGMRGGWRLTSSSRFEGVPGRRASSALDGDPDTAWIADLPPGGRAWMRLRAPREMALRRLRLAPGPAGYPEPARVSVSGVEAPVAADGSVELDRTVRGRTLRVEVTAVRPQGEGPGVRGVRAVAIGELEAPGLEPPAIPRTGTLRSRCGAIEVAAGPERAGLAISGSIEDLDAGRPLGLRGCRRLPVATGSTRLSIPPGEVARADHLALRSPAPRPVASPASPPRRVAAAESGGPPGSVERARLEGRRPGWLVLEQSWSDGWRATCHEGDGDERDLGEPVAIGAYANGWSLAGDCPEVSFAYGPQRTALAGYLVSALACLLMLAFLAVSALRSRRRAPARRAETTRADSPPDPPLRLPWRRALVAAAGVGVVGGLVFALRMGVVLAVLAVVLARAGTTARRLAAVAALCVAAMPVLYLAFPATDKGGYSFQFATDHIYPHWLGVVAVCCLAAAGLLDTRRRRARAAE